MRRHRKLSLSHSFSFFLLLAHIPREMSVSAQEEGTVHTPEGELVPQTKTADTLFMDFYLPELRQISSLLPKPPRWCFVTAA